MIEGSPVVRGRVDPVYARMVLAAVVVGVIFVLSASFPMADKTLGGEHPLHFFYRQLAWGALGLVGLVLASFGPPHRLVWGAKAAFVVGLGAMLACRWSSWGYRVGDAYCWLEIRGQTVQPSEFAKIAYVVMLASFAARMGKQEETEGRLLGRSLVAMVMMCGALAIQRDLGMAMLVVGVTLGMLFVGGVRVWKLTALALVLGGLGTGAAALSPSRWERLTTFLNPTADPLGAGYQACQMLATIARGGLPGSGLGMSPDKWGPLPTPHTDSIFCVIAGELGLIGSVLVLLLVLAMAGRGFKLAERAGTPTAWHVGCGMALLLGMQSLINIGVATVSIPCTGLTLPFISYGGSSLVASMMAAGLVLSVSRYVSVRSEGD